MSDTHPAAERHRDEPWTDYVVRQFSHIHRRIDEMSDALQQLEEDETDLAAIVPALIDHAKQQEAEVAQLRKELGEGIAVDPAKLATLEAGFGEGIAALQKLVPAAPTPGPTDLPTKAVYTFNASAEGAEPDARFTPSGFQSQSGEPLYYFSGDSAVGEVNGATVAGYTAFTDTPEPVAGP